MPFRQLQRPAIDVRSCLRWLSFGRHDELSKKFLLRRVDTFRKRQIGCGRIRYGAGIHRPGNLINYLYETK